MEFQGTSRFELIRKLGEGGMGRVYEAYDHERERHVALKTLLHADAAFVYRFKREFRVLADVRHRNIVSLYDLISDSNDWFFTMELIDGTDFVTHVNGGAPDRSERVSDALGQLADALARLHREKIVHRDLKPSNVLIDRSGRVVVTDFGLIAEVDRQNAELPTDPTVGTPAYMSPEQARREPVTAASDWYSVGAMLHQVLTGEAPRGANGGPAQISASWAPGVVRDLCIELLQKSPTARPTGDAVLRRLGRDLPDDGGAPSEVFVGRESERAVLHAAFERACEGEHVVALVRGRSGMGKTTFVQHYLDHLVAGVQPPLVLAGACHERETVPYKGFDGVVDDLSHYLLELDDADVEDVLPDDIDLLSLVFPVLARVPAARSLSTDISSSPLRLRTRAFDALGRLIAGISEARPVVIVVDDLQWASKESFDLLVDLARPLAGARVAVVLSVRRENMGDGGALGETLERLRAHPAFVDIEIGPLSADEHRIMVGRMLGTDAVASQTLERYWNDSKGHPLLTAELVRLFEEGEPDASAQSHNLEDVLSLRINKLSKDARTLLEVISLSGEPSPTKLLADAASLQGADRKQVPSLLRAAKLARSAEVDVVEMLEVFHASVAETTLGLIDEARRVELHRHIARALERDESARVDALAGHWLAAGEPGQATRYFVSAAKAAAEQLAFDRAAELFQAALDYGGHEGDERTDLQRRLAESLGYAGRGLESAEAYMAAAQSANDADAAELRRFAAEQYLRCGRIEQGLEVLKAVLAQLGVSMAATGRRAILSLVIQRARIALRGLKWKKRHRLEISEQELRRLDTLYAASTSFGMVDHIRGADFQTRQLLGALKLGEEYRVCRALAIEVVFRGSEGKSETPRVQSLHATVCEMAERIGDPYLLGVSGLASGGLRQFCEDFSAAEQVFLRSMGYFEECIGADWERLTALSFVLNAQSLQGKYAELERGLAELLEEAERTNNIYAKSSLTRIPFTRLLLARNDPERSLHDLEHALDGWPTDAYLMPHLAATFGHVLTFTYQGKARKAMELIVSDLPRIKRSMFLRIPIVGTPFWQAYGSLAARLGDLKELRRALRAMPTIPYPYTRGVRAVLMAALAARRRPEDCVGLLREAVAQFELAGGGVEARSAQYRLGEVLGGDEGEALKATAFDWFKSRGVVEPERCLGVLTPPIAEVQAK